MWLFCLYKNLTYRLISTLIIEKRIPSLSKYTHSKFEHIIGAMESLNQLGGLDALLKDI